MDQIFIILFLILFPFGQVIRIGILQPIDLVVGFGAMYSLLRRQEKPDYFKYFIPFLSVAAFSWIISIFLLRKFEVLYGLLYLFRLFSYSYFTIYVWNYANNKVNKVFLTNALIALSLVSAIFGWVQMIFFSDLRPFFSLGWDKHFLRLTGTFLDPTFIGLILVFGIALSFYKKKFINVFFLAISLAFTYSRAGYLAFLSVLALSGKKYLLIIPLFLIVMLILPTKRNQILSFTRTFSISLRLENYKETLIIFNKSPLFGVGYDNLCLARNIYIKPEKYSSHSCSGSDSSLLFIMATTGMLGLMSFLYLAIGIWKESSFPIKVTLMALLVHSIFSNSIFYPWVMGWIVVLLAIV